MTENTAILTAQIVSAYLRNHPMPRVLLPSVIRTVHAALLMPTAGDTRSPETPAVPRIAGQQPIVDAKRSVYPTFLICLNCGKRVVTLRKHLRTAHQMEPHQYKILWKLGDSYPMVAASYANLRSVMAKQSGLGKSPRGQR